MRHFKAIWIVILFATSAGCSLSTEKSQLTDHATFRVDHILGTVENYSTYKEWVFPSERLFNFTACVADIAQRTTIVGHEFEVSGGDRAYKVISDPDGCVHWPEVVAFDVFAAPTYVKIKRVIKSLGKQRGEVTFPMAINPWSGIVGSEAGVIDLARASVAKIVDLSVTPTAFKAQKNAPASLEINTVDLRMQLDAPSPTQDTSMRLEFKPNVVVKDMTGSTLRLPIEKGHFLVEARIVRLDGGNAQGAKTRLLADIPALPGQVVNGSVVIQVPRKLVSKIDRQKTYSLVLTVVPQGAPAYIRDFNAVYEIPEVSSLHAGTLSLTSEFRDQIASFNVDQYLPKSTATAAPVLDAPNAFTFDTINALQNGVPAESMMERSVRLSLSVAVHWTLDLSPAKGRLFNIYALRDANNPLAAPRVTATRAVTDSGFLEWDDVITHRMYKKQRRYDFEILFEDVLTKQMFRKCARINPWDAFSTFFRDCEAMTSIVIPNMESLVSPVEQVPKVKVDGVCFARMDSATQNLVAPDLSLQVRHRFNMALDAKVLRFDDLRTGLQTAPENMRGGWWLMTIAMFRNDVENNRVGDRDAKGRLLPITTIEKAVCNPSSPAAEIELKLNELGLMDERNYFAVQFKPLDAKKLKLINETELSAGQGCIGGDVAPDSPIEIDRDNDLVSPPYVFAFTPRMDACPIVVSGTNNYSDERIKTLIRSMETELKGNELHQMHLEAEARRQAKLTADAQALEQEKSDGYLRVAKKLVLKPILINGEEDAKAILRNAPGASAANLFNTLKCMDTAFWADKTQKPKCIDDPTVASLAKVLCLQLNPSRSGGWNGPCSEILTDLLVEEKIHVYKLLSSTVVSGFSTSLSVTDSFAVGGFTGSDYGGSISNGGSLSGDANVGLGVEKAPLSAGISAGAGLTKSWSSFNVNFTREWNDNQIGVASGTSLTQEEMDVNLEIGEYRQCYTVRTKLFPDSGYYICAPVETQRPLSRLERYYMLFNTGGAAVAINPSDERTRWLVQFRGDRLFFYMLSQFSTHLAPFHVNGIPYPIVDLIRRVRPEIKARVGLQRGSWGERFVLSSTAPENSLFEANPDSVRELPAIWWLPTKNIGDRKLRDQNVKEDREKDGASPFADP